MKVGFTLGSLQRCVYVKILRFYIFALTKSRVWPLKAAMNTTTQQGNTMNTVSNIKCNKCKNVINVKMSYHLIR